MHRTSARAAEPRRVAALHHSQAPPQANEHPPGQQHNHRKKEKSRTYPVTSPEDPCQAFCSLMLSFPYRLPLHEEFGILPISHKRHFILARILRLSRSRRRGEGGGRPQAHGRARALSGRVSPEPALPAEQAPPQWSLQGPAHGRDSSRPTTSMPGLTCGQRDARETGGREGLPEAPRW